MEPAGCILLVMGIPGSGKTALTRSIVDEHHKWTYFAVHFDDFYPPDLRVENEQEFGMKNAKQFHLKDARLKVNNCVEHFLMKNNIGSQTHPRGLDSHITDASSADLSLRGLDSHITDASSADLSSSSYSGALSVPLDWGTFVQSVNKHSSFLPGATEVLDTDGRINVHSQSKPIVLILDDNMPLKSMRYEYYQLARKYGLGFAQVGIQCSSKVAKARNVQRSIPVPDSTIDLMEQNIEYPDPSYNHWEERSIVISSEGPMDHFIRSGCERVQMLIENALANPVLPLPEVDTALKESCQIANIDSYVHQADIILRRCVSQHLEKYSTDESCSKEEKSKIARTANIVRKTILGEIRAGMLLGTKLDASLVGHAFSDQFKELVNVSFSTMLANHN